MKKLTIIIMILFIVCTINAQITFEQDYVNSDEFIIIGLENSGHKYFSIEENVPVYSIMLYNLDHILFKTIPIDISGFFPPQYDTLTDFDHFFYVYYISENLFDLDNEIEFLAYIAYWYYDYTISNYISNHKIEIYNEDCSTLFTINDASPTESMFYGEGVPASIFNTEDGTKMILEVDTIYKVYSLPGNLPCELCDTTSTGKNELNPNYNSFGLSNSYPNPTSNYTRIDYQLPAGINKAEIVFYDTKGNEVKRFAVDRTFDHLRISTAELSSGTYFYSLQTEKGIFCGKKMVVIR